MRHLLSLPLEWTLWHKTSFADSFYFLFIGKAYIYPLHYASALYSRGLTHLAQNKSHEKNIAEI